MNKYLSILAFAVIMFLLSIYITSHNCSGYTCLVFDNKKLFQETDLIESGPNSYKATIEKDDIKVRLEVYRAETKEIANRFVQVKLMQLEGLFENARSPYPGMLSNEIACEERFRPFVSEVIINGQKATTISGYLNDRLQYGTCLEDQITNIGKTAMLYCQKQKKWYFFEAIVKKSDTALVSQALHLIKSLKCQ